ncbi:hypothetical protein HA402_006421 [Bradysia odoriphaga]|nr:hypothetical protein HA402_006421 [Bradysia odoriphaga]
MTFNRCLQFFNFTRRSYSSLSDECLTVTRRNDKAVIQFNRPEKRNALTIEMQHKFATLLRDFENDSGVSAVIIKGNEAGFSAGGDVIQFIQIMKSDKKFYDCGIVFHRGLLRLAEYKKPVISLADKVCIGQAAAVTFLSSHPVVTERTLFTMPEVFVGIYNVGSSYLLARLPNNFGMWVGLTGARFIGSDIVNLGLSKNYVKSTDLDRLEDALINLEKTANFETVSQTISQFQQKCDKWSIEPNKVKQLFSGSSVEEIVENLKGDSTEFSSKILHTFSNVSPTALKLSFHIMRELQLKQYSTNQAFSADFSLYKNFYGDTDNNDFSEGVRSVLIDKKHKPNWIPKTLEEIDDKKLISYFTTNVIDIRASSP